MACAYAVVASSALPCMPSALPRLNNAPQYCNNSSKHSGECFQLLGVTIEALSHSAA